MITDNIIIWGTEYGKVRCKLKKILKRKELNLYQLERLTGIKYDVLKRYAKNEIIRYDSIVLAKLCFALECEINELLQYEVKK